MGEAMREPQKIERLDTAIQEISEKVGTLVISSDADFLLASELLRRIKAVQREISDVFDPIVKKAHAAWKEALAQKEARLKRYQEAEGRLKAALVEYRRRKEAEAAEERRRLEEEARRKREEEEARRRAELEAERKRLEEERLAAAAEAEARGDKTLAEALLSAPLPEPQAPPTEEPVIEIPVPKVEPPKAEGLVFTTRWKAEVVDFPALVQAVAMGHAPVTLLLPDLVALNRFAQATRGAAEVPGVRFFEVKEARVRA